MLEFQTQLIYLKSLLLVHNLGEFVCLFDLLFDLFKKSIYSGKSSVLEVSRKGHVIIS